jgi:hypothetical protein
MLFFYAVNLAMTAVAWDHKHPGTRGPYLIRFSAGIKDSFFVVSGYQGATTTTAADLVHVCRIKVGPVIHTLAENPTRFFEKTMPKPFLGSSPIIARIVIRCRPCKSCFVQLYAPFLNVPDEKIEHRNIFKFFKYFRVVFFKTRPGRKVSMPSFGPQECFDLQHLHLFDNTTAHDSHGLVITGKIGPVGSLPVYRRNRPVFFGHVKNAPPML